MSRILVLHASNDGQTARVAERIGEELRGQGHAVSVLPAASEGASAAIDAHDAVLVGGAIRFGHYPKYLEQLVQARAAALAERPNAFFSVCLTGGGPGANLRVARGYVDGFCRKTAWHPHDVAIFGGALLYTKYNPVIRFIIRFIVTIAGGDTDTSRDYEYTDWQAVQRFARRFSTELQAVPA